MSDAAPPSDTTHRHGLLTTPLTDNEFEQFHNSAVSLKDFDWQSFDKRFQGCEKTGSFIKMAKMKFVNCERNLYL